MDRKAANAWANLRTMLHALERALSGEVMDDKDIERLESLRYKMEREVMDAQVNTDLETALMTKDSDPRMLEGERDKFFNTWEPSEYDPNK